VAIARNAAKPVARRSQKRECQKALSGNLHGDDVRGFVRIIIVEHDVITRVVIE